VPARAPRTPKYRLHKPTGRAVVTLDGKDFYLGRHGSPESRAEYDRLVAEYLAAGRRVARAGPGEAAGDLTVSELVLSYLEFADGYYVKDGAPTVEPGNIRLALRPVRRLYGHTPAKGFGPLALKAVRRAMIDAGNCRTEVNRRIGRVVRMFKWGASEELVPVTVYQALRTVVGLRKGRQGVREKAPVKPVADAAVDAIRPHVAAQVWAMVELQRLTGMRPGEAVRLRACDLETTGPVWTYRPHRHKGEHHERERVIYLGPKAQAIVRPWLKTDLAAYLFSPREAMEARWAAQRAARKTKVQPSQQSRKKARPRKVPGDRYTVESYRRAIEAGCGKAGVPRWHPHQLRHSAATRLRREFGLDVARVILGHSSPAVTEVYAEVDRAKAIDVMGSVG
jgi:integrase